MILAAVVENKCPKAEIVRQFGNQKSTLFTILQNRDKILAANDAGVSLIQNVFQEGKFLLLEKALEE